MSERRQQMASEIARLRLHESPDEPTNPLHLLDEIGDGDRLACILGEHCERQERLALEVARRPDSDRFRRLIVCRTAGGIAGPARSGSAITGVGAHLQAKAD